MIPRQIPASNLIVCRAIPKPSRYACLHLNQSSVVYSSAILKLSNASHTCAAQTISSTWFLHRIDADAASHVRDPALWMPSRNGNSMRPEASNKIRMTARRIAAHVFPTRWTSMGECVKSRRSVMDRHQDVAGCVAGHLRADASSVDCGTRLRGHA